MVPKDEVEQMSAIDVEALARALTLPRGSVTRHNELVALGHADLDLLDDDASHSAAPRAHPHADSVSPAAAAHHPVGGKEVKGSPQAWHAQLQRRNAHKQLINMWSIETRE